MSYTKTRSRDALRWGKKYSFRRVEAKPYLITDKSAMLEAIEITFVNDTEVTHTFDAPFPSVPSVTATALDSGNNNTANVNVFIKSLTSNSVTVCVSETFTGSVMLQAIHVGD